MLTVLALCLKFHRRDIPDGLKKSVLVEPCDPIQGFQLQHLDRLPGTQPVNHFRHEVIVTVV